MIRTAKDLRIAAILRTMIPAREEAGRVEVIMVIRVTVLQAAALIIVINTMVAHAIPTVITMVEEADLAEAIAVHVVRL